MSKLDTLRLDKPLQPMPSFVRAALEQRQLMDAFLGRPPYQQNDYLGWINRAERESTKEKRLDQMLYELAQGNLFMGMIWRGNQEP